MPTPLLLQSLLLTSSSRRLCSALPAEITYAGSSPCDRRAVVLLSEVAAVKLERCTAKLKELRFCSTPMCQTYAELLIVDSKEPHRTVCIFSEGCGVHRKLFKYSTGCSLENTASGLMLFTVRFNDIVTLLRIKFVILMLLYLTFWWHLLKGPILYPFPDLYFPS